MFQLKINALGSHFSIKNRLCMSIQHFHSAEIHHYALVTSTFKIQSCNFPTNDKSNFMYIKFSGGSSFNSDFRQGTYIAKKLMTRFFQFINFVLSNTEQPSVAFTVLYFDLSSTFTYYKLTRRYPIIDFLFDLVISCSESA